MKAIQRTYHSHLTYIVTEDGNTYVFSDPCFTGGDSSIAKTNLLIWEFEERHNQGNQCYEKNEIDIEISDNCTTATIIKSKHIYGYNSYRKSYFEGKSVRNKYKSSSNDSYNNIPSFLNTMSCGC